MNRLSAVGILVGSLVAWLAPGPCGFPAARGAEKVAPSRHYLDFVKSRAASLRAGDAPPEGLDAWDARRLAIRKGLLDAWGGFLAEPCPLEPRVLGTIDRDGYRIEKIVFQTRPGVLMTANAYVPAAPGKHPAVLQVHGHWAGAKQDPVVQARCIGAVKLGYFVLAVDAFGAGERGVGKALGEYHGGMTAATLLPVGLPLSGLQVYENTRAVDYLLTRPEVDGDHIAVTGASGGGNQAMYSGAWDDRLKAVVPVCSVGNYQAYLGAACCLCEVVPGALKFTEEGGVLGLAAPRGLMVVSATRDAPQFSVAEARKSLAWAEPVFRLYDRPGQVRHTVIESTHAYNRPMREALYGWLALQLRGEGDGSPVPEPEVKTEDPEALRCYPGDTRPDDWMTIPRFAATEARTLDARTRGLDAGVRRKALVETVLGGFPDVPPVEKSALIRDELLFKFEVEPGLPLSGVFFKNPKPDSPVAVMIDLKRGDSDENVLASELQKAGWTVVTFDLRATRTWAWPGDKVGEAPDHNTAEWGLWIGRPLLGQWVFDVLRVLSLVRSVQKEKGERGETALIGKGRGGLVALCAGAVDPGVKTVVALDSLASYVTDAPYSGQTLGVMAPGILREVGDVPRIVTLIGPRRRVIIAGGVSGSGEALSRETLLGTYREAVALWESRDQPEKFHVLGTSATAGVLKLLTE